MMQPDIYIHIYSLQSAFISLYSIEIAKYDLFVLFFREYARNLQRLKRINIKNSRKHKYEQAPSFKIY